MIWIFAFFLQLFCEINYMSPYHPHTSIAHGVSVWWSVSWTIWRHICLLFYRSSWFSVSKIFTLLGYNCLSLEAELLYMRLCGSFFPSTLIYFFIAQLPQIFNNRRYLLILVPMSAKLTNSHPQFRGMPDVIPSLIPPSGKYRNFYRHLYRLLLSTAIDWLIFYWLNNRLTEWYLQVGLGRTTNGLLLMGWWTDELHDGLMDWWTYGLMIELKTK